MSEPYDLIVIGSGSAAQVAIARVRERGWRVAVIDHRPFGGTCALRGCDPKKMLVSGEEALDAARRMRSRGVEGELRIDWPGLMAFKRSFTDPIPAKQEQRYADLGVHAYHGLARFASPDRIDVVRVRTDPARPDGSIIDMRSIGRVGGSDVGVNAGRIQAFLADLQTAQGDIA